MKNSIFALTLTTLPTVLGVRTGLVRHGLEAELGVPIKYISLNKRVNAASIRDVS